MIRNPNDRVTYFLEHNGYSHLYDNLGLTPDSHVLDVGGFLGVWALDIFTRYTPHMHICEPHPGHFFNLYAKTRPWQPAVNLYPLALSGYTGEAGLTRWNEAGTLLRTTTATNLLDPRISVPVIQASRFLNLYLPKLDLLALNVEGSEYDILEDLLRHDLLRDIPTLEIQFHDLLGPDPFHVTPLPECHPRREKIQQALANTHVQTFNVDYVWEVWKNR